MDLRWHCVLVHSEIRVWFPPLRVLLLHETGAEQSGIKMTRKHIVRSVVNRGDVLIMTYAGLRCVALVRTSAVTEGGGGVSTPVSNPSIAHGDACRNHAAELLQHEWSYVILDEGHQIRNPEAAITLVYFSPRLVSFLASGNGHDGQCGHMFAATCRSPNKFQVSIA